MYATFVVKHFDVVEHAGRNRLEVGVSRVAQTISFRLSGGVDSRGLIRSMKTERFGHNRIHMMMYLVAARHSHSGLATRGM